MTANDKKAPAATPSKRKAGETRGLKKGQRHSGQFTSDDPRRIKLTPEHRSYRATFADKCRAHSDDVVEFLHSTMMDADGQGKIRMEAARELADRAFGRAVGVDVIANLNGDNAKVVSDVATLSDEAILELLVSAGASLPPPTEYSSSGLSEPDAPLVADAEYVEIDATTTNTTTTTDNLSNEGLNHGE